MKSFPWLQSLPQRVKLLRAPINELDYEGAMRAAYWATVQRAPKDPFDSEQDQRAKTMTYLTVHWFMQTLIQRQEAMAELTGLTVRAPFCDAEIISICITYRGQ
ncbi:MAG: asparagine synthase-related protein [Holdemania massiliensis]